MKKALYFEKLENGVVKCKLCPHYCMIGEDDHGICNVRINHNGVLYNELFEKVASFGFDPIEKKPLYHFYPGSKILSIGVLGCNLKCMFCHNYRISQISPDEFEHTKLYTAQNIVKIAREAKGNIGIAFTYNEPGTFYEYMLEVSGYAKEYGLKTVMVTNGYINRQPLDELIPFIDAFNVDLKAFSEGFYKEITQSRLAPVKKTIKTIALSGNHLEITNLVIPGLNDNFVEFEEMVKWIAHETGERTVLHISRYFPSYRLKIDATPVNTLLDLYEIAKKHLKFVYIGNVIDTARETTYCDSCNEKLIVRESLKTTIAGLDKEGNCTSCGNHVIDHI
jgi:pyruvate formate lyase activating enzyme